MKFEKLELTNHEKRSIKRFPKKTQNHLDDCASPLMRKKLDALGKALGSQMEKDLKEFNDIPGRFPKRVRKHKAVNPKPYRKSESRTEAWARLCIEALDALSDLESLRAEYEEILDNVPENLLSGRYAEKLQDVLDIDIEGALDIINEANCLELPLGFGRD